MNGNSSSDTCWSNQDKLKVLGTNERLSMLENPNTLMTRTYAEVSNVVKFVPRGAETFNRRSGERRRKFWTPFLNLFFFNITLPISKAESRKVSDFPAVMRRYRIRSKQNCARRKDVARCAEIVSKTVFINMISFALFTVRETFEKKTSAYMYVRLTRHLSKDQMSRCKQKLLSFRPKGSTQKALKDVDDDVAVNHRLSYAPAVIEAHDAV